MKSALESQSTPLGLSLGRIANLSRRSAGVARRPSIGSSLRRGGVSGSSLKVHPNIATRKSTLARHRKSSPSSGSPVSFHLASLLACWANISKAYCLVPFTSSLKKTDCPAAALSRSSKARRALRDAVSGVLFSNSRSNAIFKRSYSLTFTYPSVYPIRVFLVKSTFYGGVHG